METTKYNILAYIGIGTFLLIGIIIAIGYIQGDGTVIEKQINSTTIIGDKEKVYDADTKTVTFKEAKGTKEEIGWIKLETPLDNHIGAGYSMIAQYICSNSSYCLPSNIETYNLKEGSVVMNKQIDYYYLSKGTKEIIDYTQKCSDKPDEKTGEYICKKQVQVGTHFEDEWLPYTDKIISNKPITISLWTTVEVGEKGEWIPTFTVSGTDIRVQEFAVWTVDLNTGLVSYWNLDEGASNYAKVFDSLYLNNMTNWGAVNTTGKIKYGYNFTPNEYLNASDSTSLDLSGTNLTVSLWYKTDVTLSDSGILSRGTSGDDIMQIGGASSGSGNCPKMHLATTTGGYKVTTPGAGCTTGVWYHLVGRWNGTTLSVWIDGNQNQSVTSGSGGYTGTTSNLWLAKDIGSLYLDGQIDEVGIWNRSLTNAEISQLYNGGTGITYTNIFYGSANCNFTGYVKDSGGTGLSGANVVIINQTDNKRYYNTTSNEGGLWTVNVSNNNYTIDTPTNHLYNVVSYYNNSLVGISKPFINSTCP